MIRDLATCVSVVVWLNGNGVDHINEVALRWARLVLGWVTVSGSTPVTEIYLGLTNHPGQLSLTIPPWVGGMSTDDGFLATTREETRVLCVLCRPGNQKDFE